MTSAKPQKDKPHVANPRLVPRPTAASAARAARNATNRNLTVPSAQRQSPARSPPSPAVSKIKTAISRNGQRTDSKADLKLNRNCESEVRISELDDTDPYLTTDNDEKIIDYKMEGQILSSNDDNEQETLQEPDNFELKVHEDSTLSTRTQVIDIPKSPVVSRPQTPKSVSSRPQTPQMASRPSTPAQPTHRHSNPISRPNTPQKITTPLTRPRTPSLPVSSIPRPITPITTLNSPASVIKEGEDMKSLYTTKKSQFRRLKKELDLKQQEVLEVYDGLRVLREHMAQEGIPSRDSGGDNLVVFNVADWAPEEFAQLCRDAVSSSATDGAIEIFNTTQPIDERALAEVESKALDIPSHFADLCLQAFTARQELIDWVKELIKSNDFDGSDAVNRIACYNSQGLQLCEALRELKSRADDAVDTVTSLSKQVCRERSTLLAIGESLVREIAHLRQDLESQQMVLIEKQEIRSDHDISKLLEETRRELEDERTAKNTMKDKLASTETQLRQTRLRVSKMDKQLREAEASIASLTGTVKNLEDQSRQREVQLEARARKLRESLKTGEVASNQLAQKRDSLQSEVDDLKEQVQKITAQNKAEVLDLNKKINELVAALEEERKISQKEMEEKEQLQTSLGESQNAIEDLKAKIIELENSKPNPDLPTEREMDLWAELQAVKDTLRNTEDEVAASKREKVRFLETFTKIAESENKVGLQQKLASELLSKEETVAKMQTQIREMSKNIKLNEQKVIQYEQYVRNLQAHNCAVANCQESPNGISYQDLQQEIMNLRMELLDSGHRNEELSEMLLQKEQQLEQQDKTSRAQARVIKVREELINMLKKKETEQSRELSNLQEDLEQRMKIVDEVNKQIAAKANEIQELFSTLENKQQQIHRLEKIVLALEEQQRRAQAQRTRHEEKIAALEHELAAGGNRRERKFLFF